MKIDLNQVKHTADEYGIRPQAKDFPMMCVVGFSYVCNSRCPSCPYTNSDIRNSYKDALFMSEETFKTIADQCGEYNALIRISGGGEPMLNPRVVELIEYAKRAGAKVGLITNGSLFSPEKAERLLKANIDMIEFSVDAYDATTYSSVRPGLDWNKLVHNVKTLVDLRNEIKGNTKIIASGVNQQGVNIDEVENFWSQYVDHFQKRKFLTWGRGDSQKSADSTPYLDPKINIPCPFIFERLNIDSRGNVSVCGYVIDGSFVLGNVHEKEIKDIWLGEEISYYRKMHLDRMADKIKPCNNCSDRKYRTWTYNYWKVMDIAEEERKKLFKE